MTMTFRKAVPADATSMTELNNRSKAYWNYPKEMLESWKSELTVTEKMIREREFFVGLIENTLAAVIGFGPKENDPELEYFFLDPQFIGKGYGTQMWSFVLKCCKSFQWTTLKIISDPSAERFYLSKGALKAGEHESPLWKGRKLPILIFKTEQKKFVNTFDAFC